MDLTGIRGAIFNVNGVSHLSMAAIPGAAELLAEPNEKHFPYRLLTNTRPRAVRHSPSTSARSACRLPMFV